ncbi:MAG: nucleotidyltransferase domain-containing protein [Candidatus Thorarchaeota archaeon]|nr:nucleotidyltransferase domain-containing protein [Candidatus Thorarchaeota archaeon]
MLQDIEAARRRNEKSLRAALERLLAYFRQLGAERVVLFGSLASGKVNEWSDIDLLVVMPSDRPGKEWRRTISGEVERPVALDLLVFTSSELDENLPASSLLREIMANGVVLYEK